VYVLAPGSDAFKKLVEQNPSKTNGARERTLIYNSVEAIATGDSVLLAVQDSPAHFSFRYMKSDPTEAMRNSLMILTRILRVASAYVPLVAGVGDALGAPAPPQALGAASDSETTTVTAAEEAIASFDERARAVANDAVLQDVLARLRADPSAAPSPKDMGTLVEKVKLLETVLGGP
jgi:hypothetical protein